MIKIEQKTWNFFKEHMKMTDGHVENMLKITHHQGNGNQNHKWDITWHLSEWFLPKGQERACDGKNVKQKVSSCTIAGNVNWHNHYGRHYGGSSKI